MDTVLGAAATCAFLVLFALPVSTAASLAVFLPWRRRTWSVAYARAVLGRHIVALVVLVAMLLPENAESLVDPWVTARLPWRDAPTAFIASYEHGLHAALQALPGKWLLQPVMSLAYVIGFPYLIIGTTALSIWRDDGRRARQAAAVYALCFAFALPFYLFLPVKETWFWYGPHNDGAVQQLALHYPIVRDALYSFNEVDNCFPSLHTAIAVALALVARGTPRFGRFAAWWTAAIVASTLYLGIHWVTDVVAGAALGWGVHRLVRPWWSGWASPAPPAAGKAKPAKRAEKVAVAPMEAGLP